MKNAFLLLSGFLLLACVPSQGETNRERPYIELNLTPPSTKEKKEIERLLEEAFGEALSETPATATTAEKVMRINWWVHTHLYQVDPEPPNSLLKILQQRRGQCGSSSHVFQLLVQKLGIQTRSVGLFCIPKQNGHVAAEVYYDGAWHLFDPSFGVFFTANGNLNGPVVSLSDLKAFPGLVENNIFYPVSHGRMGWNYPPMQPQSMGELYRRAQPGYQANWGDYVLFINHTCGATSYAEGSRIELPFKLSLASRTRYNLGEVDGSTYDVSMHLDDRGFYDATGQYVLGDSSSSLGPVVIDHRYLIKGLARDVRVGVKLYRQDGASLRLARFQAYGAKITRIEYVDDDEVSVDMVAQAPVAELRSWSEGDARIFLDAVTFLRDP